MPKESQLEFKIEYVPASSIERRRLTTTNPLILCTANTIKTKMKKGDGYFIACLELKKAGYTSIANFKSALNRYLDQNKIERGDLTYCTKKTLADKQNGEATELGLYIYIPS